jgi:anaerobic ribonucleoside-triphosphate reductase activating protein
MKINYILENSFVQGPGNRFTIWVQGCSIHCDGCKNKDTWDFNKGTEYSVLALIEKIKSSKAKGLTLTGGEPLNQYNDVLNLVKQLYLLKNIFLCTGYTLNHVKKHNSEILNYIDIICSGPFEKKQICSGFWKGSANQQVIALTKKGKELLKQQIIKKEFRINKHTGQILTTGFTQ